MAKYSYQARDGRGELASGVVDAASLEAAGQMLRSEGKYVIRIGPTGEQADSDTMSIAAHARRVKRTDVIFFTHQMAVMVETGVSLTDALQCCAEQSTDPHFRAVLRDVTNSVQAGGEFSAALRKHPRVFPSIMTSLLKASEVSGTMAAMLERISTYMMKEHQTIKQARGAMLYPCFMLFMAVSVTIFLLTVVMPKFATIYESRKAVLPGPTRVLLALSHGLVTYWYIWLALAIGITLTVWLGHKTPTGRRIIDWMKLNLPLAKRLYSQLYLTRACSTMGTMISSGVAMLDMIAIVKKVTDNTYFQDLWDEVDDKLRQGAQLSDPLFASPLIPRSVAQMIYSGEKSGQLGKVMNRIASYTEAEFDQTVKTTTAMIEPIMVAVMGAIIGFIAISLLLPIFSVGRVVAGT